MVDSATNFSKSGLADWIIQRVTAVVLGIYLIVLLAFIFSRPHMDFNAWQYFFYCPYIRIFSFLALLCLVAHAWIGVWTIFTDYIKPKGLRLFLETIMVLALFSYLAWGISIIWA